MQPKTIKKQHLLVAATLLTAMLIQVSCEKFFYTEPIEYPRTFAFKGEVRAEDSTLIPGIRILLSTPGSYIDDTIYTNTNGTYWYLKELYYAGPNKLSLADTDGPSNGGSFVGTDTTFYIRKEDWDSSQVIYHFTLKKK